MPQPENVLKTFETEFINFIFKQLLAWFGFLDFQYVSLKTLKINLCGV